MLFGGFVLLAVIVAMAVLFAARERLINAEVQKTLITEDRLSDTMSRVGQAEVAVRGYMLTGNRFSELADNAALVGLPENLQKAEQLLTTGPDARDMATVDRLTRAKLAEDDRIVALLKVGDKAAAVAQLNADLNVRTMDDLRQLITGVRREEERRLARDECKAAHASRTLQMATIAAVLGTVLLAWFAIRTNRAQNNQLRAAETALIATNEALEQKVAERTSTLNASEARFRLLSETIPARVYLSSPAGKTLYVNPQSCEYFGRPAERLLDYGWTDCVHPDDLAPCLELWNACVAAGRDYEKEYRLRRHDGAFRWFLDRARALRNAEGAVTAWIGTAIDIHDRKVAEAALANTNAELERRVAARSAELNGIFRLSTDILTVSGFDGRFISVSPAWERVTGWSVAEALKRPMKAFVHPDDVAPSAAIVAELQKGQPVAVKNRFRRADGSWCWLSWQAVPQLDQKLIYSVARDVTAEHEHEEQLRQSQKMEVIGQLTGGVAHDFNNLLTIILGSLELLQRNAAEADPKTIRRLEAACEAARRAAALTQRLLAFSRRQSLAPKVVDVNRLLAGMSDMLGRTLGEMVDVETRGAEELWPVLVDANQLENAILNLAVNARDAMPLGGRLSIETQNVDLRDAGGTRLDVPPGPYILITVTDSGTGMTPEVQAKVFEPFFTTKPPGQGTGLGLAQVYGFIKQSGGQVSLSSAPGKGTTVKLYLPRTQRGMMEDACTAMPPRVQGRGEIVLVVEDEPGVRGFSAEVLSGLGYTVLTAENAARGLEIFETTPDVKMLFTDVVLGAGMNGRELADEIRRRKPETIVLFTTGYSPDVPFHHDRSDEWIEFIGKPFTATELAEKVFALLGTTEPLELSPVR
jgi:PAS domain S-box-containing protein